jgi:hypothetical protein
MGENAAVRRRFDGKPLESRSAWALPPVGSRMKRPAKADLREKMENSFFELLFSESPHGANANPALETGNS